jgi:hypothetical protein
MPASSPLRDSYYAASYTDFEIRRFGHAHYIMLDGYGDPLVDDAFRHAAATMTRTARQVRKSLFQSDGLEITLPPLEALWWAEDMSAFAHGRKSEWQWTVMRMLPSIIPIAELRQAVRSAQNGGYLKGGSRGMRVGRYADGQCVQIGFRGAYQDSGPTLGRLHGEFLPQHHLVPTGKYHEIYLNDAQRTKPENLRTILRQPVATAPRAPHGSVAVR